MMLLLLLMHHLLYCVCMCSMMLSHHGRVLLRPYWHSTILPYFNGSPSTHTHTLHCRGWLEVGSGCGSLPKESTRIDDC
jgi:hypothetical protein